MPKTAEKTKAPQKSVSSKKRSSAASKKKTKTASTKKAKSTKSTDNAFAIIETGGKQYHVEPGQVILVEKLSTIKKGTVVFDKVLLVDNGKDTQIGDPYLKGAKVEAAIEEEGKGKKIEVIRFHAKSRHLKRKGHRQPYTKVKITAIK